MKKKVGQALLIAAFLLLYAAAAFAVAYVVYLGGDFPQGQDTMFHIYRGDFLLREVEKGNYYPLFDSFWYNGVQPMRYFGPLGIYILALSEAVMGDVFAGYYLYVAIAFLLGAVCWLYCGARRGRVLLGGFLGLLWFFLPNNLYTLFSVGNLPAVLAMDLFPLLIFHVAEFLEKQKFSHAVLTGFWFFFVLLLHPGYGGMLSIALMLYCFLNWFINRGEKGGVTILFALGLPFLLLGVWFYPALRNGLTDAAATRAMKQYFQSAAISLNPVYRFTTLDKAYFGLSVFLLILFGIICSKRKSMPGLWTALLLYLGSTMFLYPLISAAPGSEYLWMIRFFSIALGLVLFSLLLWKSLKNWILLIICALLVLDCVPSIPLLYRGNNAYFPEERLEEYAADRLLDEAKELTDQRLAILDANYNGATPHFYAAGYGDKRVRETFGYGEIAAATKQNVGMLNEALADGAYPYLFDRAVEYGDDTILIHIPQLEKGGSDLDYLNASAGMSDYTLVDQNEDYLLYHRDFGLSSFGTVNTYRGIGIGTNSSGIELFYPVMEEGESDNLTDYTFEELKDYEMIYLDHFEYDDLETAEELVKQLADSGVRIVINADGIPVNGISKVQEFLGVNCSRILFENGYPFLYVDDERYDLDFFAEGYEDWESVFLNNLDSVSGYFFDNSLQEAFIGTVYNDNITIFGLNLIYHYMLTGDPYAGYIIQEIVQLDPEDLPEREIVPITVSYGADTIIIETDREDVNTGIAFQDNFSSDSTIWSGNYMVTVPRGQTVIRMSYPYFKQGVALSFVGIMMTILFLAIGRASWSEKYKEKHR